MTRLLDRHIPTLAAAILAEPVGAKLGGVELVEASGLRTAVVYRLLTKFYDAGWLTDGWTDDPRPRRYYVATDEGRAMMKTMTAVTR